MLDRLFRGLGEAATAYGCAVVGGDLSVGPVPRGLGGGHRDHRWHGERSCDRAAPGRPALRHRAARRSAAGLRALQGSFGPPEAPVSAAPPGRRRRRAVRRLAAAYRRPVAGWPRARRLGGGATAMIDVSDGLGIDLDHLATASGVGVVLEEVPVAEGASP